MAALPASGVLEPADRAPNVARTDVPADHDLDRVRRADADLLLEHREALLRGEAVGEVANTGQPCLDPEYPAR